MRYQERAFTLIEVAITITIFIVLVIAVVQLYLVYGRVITLQQSSIGVALGGSAIIDTVQSAGLQASQIALSHMFSGKNYTSGTTTVIFEIPAIDASGTVISNAYDYIGIYASSTVAYRVIDAAPGSVRGSGTKILSDKLGSLSFSYDNVDIASAISVIVDATTSVSTKGQITRVHLQEHIYLRN